MADKKLLTSLAIAFSSVATYTAFQVYTPEMQRELKMHGHSMQRESKPAAASVAAASRGSSGADGSKGDKESTGEEGKEKKPAAEKKRAVTPAIDKRFFNRLAFVMRIVVPRWNCKETFLLLTQVAVLVSRTMLSLRIARLGGDGLQAVLQRSWRGFAVVLSDFFVSGLSAAVVNSALKYLTNSITVAFRQRLTQYVHDKYLEKDNYYKAAVLRVGNLDNADQRIVEDLNQFCATAADLWSRTFKPALDVVLATARMSENMGWKGLAVLYTYFAFGGTVVRRLSPPFSKYIAEMQKREGDLRSGHARLIANAEEVAFLHGASREKGILNDKLARVTAFSRFYFLLQFGQGCIDQYALKYFASMIGWPIIAVPFLMKTDMPVAEVAARYRESDSLIQSASGAIGDLLMVYKKLQRLAGFTGRVAELLEAVDTPNDENGTAEESGEAEAEVPATPGNESVLRDGTADAESIRFDNVTIHAPDGRLLVKDINLLIRPGENLLVTGANGAGKTSLFRCLAGLWQPTGGRIVRPASAVAANGHVPVFYVPQRPYLVTGTLRDQVIYPHVDSGDASVDAAVLRCLAMVNLSKLVHSSDQGLDLAPHDWAATLSGGEKQRVGLARLYYHRPRFAVLDEATSAINPDEEGMLYNQVVGLGITVFSIAHRLELKKFHHRHVHFAADGTGAWSCEPIAGTGPSPSPYSTPPASPLKPDLYQ